MTFTQVSIAALMLSASSLAFADIRIIDTQAGSWVKVTENGKPAANARVSVNNPANRWKVYKTNEHGEVFIPLRTHHSSTLTYSILTEEWNEYTRLSLHTDSFD
ncbi:hypothetical protein ACQKPX_04285 [Photobacterium sp. DNB23_23_1]|uniref:Uncharacterized protein n=1 Tax=Photobacterium pectinilyticum TaxID=2906793 RepID=A0ABT1N5R0_9GAMM|nr:hypothetical protein [Photobacterium sp. ZSDE20]MCQ1060082.1 hypothetical protein [Photobacterium sp. ZSDE20]MDD1827261.1 hypothetical protein [Photobacterium sp. ZSDE20]